MSLEPKAGRRVAVVTGGASGIGLRIAERLVAEGHAVVLVDRSAAATVEAERLRAAGHTADAFVLDVTDETTLCSCIGKVGEQHGRIDIVINNAGIQLKREGRKIRVEEMTTSEWNTMMAVNMTAGFVLIRECIPWMRRNRWGRIVSMSSQAARTRSDMTNACYSASKAALIGFSRILAAEVAGDGITVNCIAPGRIETPMTAATKDRTVLDAYLNRTPVRRFGQPDDIANAALFFVAETSDYITGSVIDVNGGYYMA